MRQTRHGGERVPRGLAAGEERLPDPQAHVEEFEAPVDLEGTSGATGGSSSTVGGPPRSMSAPHGETRRGADDENGSRREYAAPCATLPTRPLSDQPNTASRLRWLTAASVGYGMVMTFPLDVSGPDRLGVRRVGSLCAGAAVGVSVGLAAAFGRKVTGTLKVGKGHSLKHRLLDLAAGVIQPKYRWTR